MRKFTLFAMLLVGILAGRAQSAIVGTYTGDMNLTHITGDEATVEVQTVTIAEVDGKFNVTCPSISILGRFDSGAFTIADVTVTTNADGSYSLNKEVFEISITSPMLMKYPYSTFSASVYADGSMEMTVEVIQNPEMGAATSAYFYASVGGEVTPEEPSVDMVTPIAGIYEGTLHQAHLVPNIPETTDSAKMVTVEKATDSTAVVKFPSVTVLGRTITGDFVIEDVKVDTLENNAYALTKDTFAINVTAEGGMTTSYGFCSLTGVVTDDSVSVVVKVVQNPMVGALNTSTFKGKKLDSSTFVWGTPEWSTEDNVVYEGIAEYEQAALTLNYPNPTGFTLTYFNIILVEYDIYIDDAETPLKYHSSAQGGTNVPIDYRFAEGHTYHIVTTKAQLAQANIATRTTDTLSTNLDSYEITFTINGPELQKTIDVEAWMSLAITNQEYTKTISKVEPTEICAALGINDISEATMHPLSPNDSYCDHMDHFDWWRDADGEFTKYNGGWDAVFGRNAYPAVYSIKINAAADSVTYYFYDYWKVIADEEPGTVGGSTLTRAPQTVYTNDTVNWDNGDGTFTKYRRSYRVEEGKDYQSRVMYVANGKSVILRATLHFVSEEEWNEKTAIEEPAKVAAEAVEYYSISGVRQAGLQQGINIVRYADGTTRKVMVK